MNLIIQNQFHLDLFRSIIDGMKKRGTYTKREEVLLRNEMARFLFTLRLCSTEFGENITFEQMWLLMPKNQWLRINSFFLKTIKT